MRDMIVVEKMATLQQLRGGQQAAPADPMLASIPTYGQMLLGFILPFALAFVAIPLESFMHSARTVGGAAFVVLVRVLAFVLRVLGNLVRQLCKVLTTLYDVTIVLPLLIERMVKAARGGGEAAESRPIKRAA